MPPLVDWTTVGIITAGLRLAVIRPAGIIGRWGLLRVPHVGLLGVSGRVCHLWLLGVGRCVSRLRLDGESRLRIEDATPGIRIVHWCTGRRGHVGVALRRLW